VAAAAEPLGVLGRRGSAASADVPAPALPAHLAPGALGCAGAAPAPPPAAGLAPRGGPPGAPPPASQGQPFAQLLLPGGHTAYTFLPGAGLPSLTPQQAAAAMASFPYQAALSLAGGLPAHLGSGLGGLSAAYARSAELPLVRAARGPLGRSP